MREDRIPPIAGINPVAEAGYPDVYCPVIFLPACNFRCDYCLNSSIVIPEKPIIDFQVDFEDVISICENLGSEQILISGGEPCAYASLPTLIRKLGERGLSVRLSTNGSYPEALEHLLGDGLVSFVAMDIKCDLHEEIVEPDGTKTLKFSKLVHHSIDPYATRDKILTSLGMIEMAADGIGVPQGFEFTYEVRTTLYPPLVGKSDIEGIAKLLQPDCRWFLQQFRAKDGLIGGEKTASTKPYDDSQVVEMIQIAKNLGIGRVDLRYP